MRHRLMLGLLAVMLPASAFGQVVISTSASPLPSEDKGATLKMLGTRIPEIEFRDVPLRSALESITGFLQSNVVIRWNVLADAGIADDRPVSMRVRNCAVSYALWLVLSEAGGTDALLAYRASGSTLIISTDEDLGREMITRVYEVNDLLQTVHRFQNAPRLDVSQALSGDSSGSSALQTGTEDEPAEPARDATQISRFVELIQTVIEPDSWHENGGRGTIAVWQNSIIVRNSPAVHQALAGYQVHE